MSNILSVSKSNLPIVHKVFSKTTASDIIAVPCNDWDDIVSVDLAKILKYQCNYLEPTKYYFNSTNISYNLVYSNEKFVNHFHDINYISVEDDYAAPFFKDVLMWLSNDDNYNKYSSYIFSVKEYLYHSRLDYPTGSLYYMDYMEPGTNTIDKF